MKARALLDDLALHNCADDEEARSLELIRSHLANVPEPFSRQTPSGHITGSAIILSSAGDRVLLLHHRKLDRWLQPGGHSDEEDASPLHTALREATEETGIADLEVLTQKPFDVDAHTIPPRGETPAHVHYDIRYLVTTRAADVTRNVDETNDCRWFSWEDLESLELDPALRRALMKAREARR